jgi:hypothetical protein
MVLNRFRDIFETSHQKFSCHSWVVGFIPEISFFAQIIIIKYWKFLLRGILIRVNYFYRFLYIMEQIDFFFCKSSSIVA